MGLMVSVLMDERAGSGSRGKMAWTGVRAGRERQELGGDAVVAAVSVRKQNLAIIVQTFLKLKPCGKLCLALVSQENSRIAKVGRVVQC